MSEPTPKDPFPEATRRVALKAKELVIEFKHTHITPEHLLLVLLADGGRRIETVLSRAQATRDQIRALVLHHLRPGEEAIPEHLITFSERAKRVIESAKVEAQRMQEHEVAPEHLLLGLTQVPNTVCGAVLRAVGITGETARGALTSGPPAPQPQG